MYYRNRYYDTTIGRFFTHDLLDYVDGMNLYEYIRGNPQNYFDPLGLGVLAGRIKRIEDYLKLGMTELAAGEARLMYKIIASSPNIFIYPTAQMFLRRWLNNKGGNYNLSPGEVKGILNKTKRCIAYRLLQKSITSGYRTIVLSQITAKSRTDYFYALGWFKVSFVGEVCVSGNKIIMEGTFAIDDVYDWQDPAGKSVDIGGDRVYDYYATLVENYGMARSFKIHGEAGLKKTYDVSNVSPSDCNPSRSR